MKIALVQVKASRNPAANLARGLDAFWTAARAGADLVVFPELAFLPFLPRRRATARALALAEPIPGPTTDRFAAEAARAGVVVVLNLFERRAGRTYDASPVIDADGSLRGITRMVHIMDGPGFRERGYYAPAADTDLVVKTRVGRVGVCICYDRHFPEYMRGLALAGAEIVVIPQAGVVGEWPAGLFEAEVRVAAFQNGYFGALANRVGREGGLRFAGESFVAGPDGSIIARAPRGREGVLLADCDRTRLRASPARRHFLPDRRPSFYRRLKLGG
ncbi:MAG: carbon-nitrogen hydrolase family protein [Candidatus Aminicenantes bacterium]|nr:carbon-nitrogen hydrolase family protein [Candidatus Aminicenantes bacterium]